MFEALNLQPPQERKDMRQIILYSDTYCYLTSHLIDFKSKIDKYVRRVEVCSMMDAETNERLVPEDWIVLDTKSHFAMAYHYTLIDVIETEEKFENPHFEQFRHNKNRYFRK